MRISVVISAAGPKKSDASPLLTLTAARGGTRPVSSDARDGPHHVYA